MVISWRNTPRTASVFVVSLICCRYYTSIFLAARPCQRLIQRFDCMPTFWRPQISESQRQGGRLSAVCHVFFCHLIGLLTQWHQLADPFEAMTSSSTTSGKSRDMGAEICTLWSTACIYYALGTQGASIRLTATFRLSTGIQTFQGAPKTPFSLCEPTSIGQLGFLFESSGAEG